MVRIPSLPALRAIPALLLLVTAGASELQAATADNHNLWLNYVGDHPLFGSPWGLHLEVQNRLSDWGNDWQQLLVRPGINYAFTPSFSASMGYGYIRTYPYGELPAAHEFDEHRIWEQLLYKHGGLGLEWIHRVRLEQRWIEELGRRKDGNYETTNWRGENRIRYMLRTNVPVSEDKKTCLAIWDEVSSISAATSSELLPLKPGSAFPHRRGPVQRDPDPRAHEHHHHAEAGPQGPKHGPRSHRGGENQKTSHPARVLIDEAVAQRKTNQFADAVQVELLHHPTPP